MRRFVVLLSGRGSNLIAIHQAMQAQHWPHELVGVLSNVPNVGGIAYAMEHGIPCQVIAHNNFENRAAFEHAMMQWIDLLQPDLLVLAGFMRVLSRTFIQHFPNRILNIHPSLLPSFSGLHTHQRALQAKVNRHGATVHLVTEELDAGPILAQGAIDFDPEKMDENTLAARVLQVEHRLYPATLRAVLDEEILLNNGKPELVARHHFPSEFIPKDLAIKPNHPA